MLHAFLDLWLPSALTLFAVIWITLSVRRIENEAHPILTRARAELLGQTDVYFTSIFRPPSFVTRKHPGFAAYLDFHRRMTWRALRLLLGEFLLAGLMFFLAHISRRIALLI